MEKKAILSLPSTYKCERASGGLLTSLYQGLCTWTLIGAVPPDPSYRIRFCDCNPVPLSLISGSAPAYTLLLAAPFTLKIASA